MSARISILALKVDIHRVKESEGHKRREAALQRGMRGSKWHRGEDMWFSAPSSVSGEAAVGCCGRTLTPHAAKHAGMRT